MDINGHEGENFGNLPKLILLVFSVIKYKQKFYMEKFDGQH